MCEMCRKIILFVNPKNFPNGNGITNILRTIASLGRAGQVGIEYCDEDGSITVTDTTGFVTTSLKTISFALGFDYVIPLKRGIEIKTGPNFLEGVIYFLNHAKEKKDSVEILEKLSQEGTVLEIFSDNEEFIKGITGINPTTLSILGAEHVSIKARQKFLLELESASS